MKIITPNGAITLCTDIKRAIPNFRSLINLFLNILLLHQVVHMWFTAVVWESNNLIHDVVVIHSQCSYKHFLGLSRRFQ